MLSSSFQTKKDEDMAATLRHFAISAGDVDRARAFYETVFDWTFKPWGPPGFFQIPGAGDGLMGALQERPEMGSFTGSTTFMTTFGVDDIGATLKAVVANGGKVIMQPYRIDGVGEIAYIEDCEGNKTGVAQYEPGYWG
jgi:uncharacterized protein